MRWGFRWRTACAVVVVTSAVALPCASAEAQGAEPVPGVATRASMEVSSRSLINNLQTLVAGVPGTAQSLLCPATGGIPLLGIVTCNLDVLSYKWHTEFKRADGTIVKRDIGALLQVPTLLNVDDDALPDIIATVGLRSLTPPTLGITIDRFLGEAGTLPLSVEAIVPDPTKGSLPRKNINFGYDTKDSRAPGHWDTTVAVRPVTGGVGIDMLTNVTGQGDSYTLLGGVFNGTPSARVDEAGGRLRYSNPAPAATGLSFDIGKSYGIGLTTSEPTVLDADAVFNTGVDRISGGLRVDKLQTNTEVVLTPQGPDKRQITYSASGNVNQMIGAYRHFTDNGGGSTTPLETLRAKVTDVPKKITVNQTSKSAANMTTAGTGPIGSIEVGFANGEPVFLPAVQNHYVHVFGNAGGLKSFAGRIDGLTEASFDAQSKITAEAQFKSERLTVKVDQPDLKVDGLLDKVPAHVKGVIDLPNGSVDYDGFGSPIDTIDVKASGTAPFFGRADHIDATVKALPPKVHVDFKPDGTSANFAASPDGIGSIEVAAYKAGDKELPPGTEAGAIYRDVPSGKYALGARILGLKSVAFTGGATYKVKTEITKGPFNLAYQDGTQQLDGRIQDLPGTIDLSLNLPDGVATYTASDKIDKITVDAKRTTPFFQKATRVRGEIDGLPASLALSFKPDGTSAQFVASTPIDKLELSATNGGTQGVPGTGAGAVYRDTASDYTAAGRILGLKSVTFKGGSTYELGAKIKPGPFSLTFETADFKLDGAIKDIPDDISLKIDPATGTYQYAGSNTIGEISADLSATAPFLANVKKARAIIKGIPASMTVTAKPDNSGIKATATSGIGSIDVALASDTIEPVAGTGAGVRATLLPNVLRAALRVNGLSTVEYVPDPLKVTVGATAGQAFSIDAKAQFGSMTEPMVVTGGIENIPSSVTVSRDTAGGKDNINYNASDPINKIELHGSKLPGGFVNFADVVVTGVPKNFQVKLPQNDTFGFDALGAGVGAIQVEASKDGSHFSGLPSGNVARYDAIGDGAHAFARITNLNKVDVSLGSTKEVAVDFSQAPDPLTADLDIKPTTGDETSLHAHMGAPPQTIKVQMLPGADAKIHYEASSKIPAINVDAAFGGSAVIHGTISNVPTQLDVCVGKDLQCNEDDWYDFLQKFGFSLHTNAPADDPVRLDALVCLTVNSGAMDVDNCIHNGKKYVRIVNLEFNDVVFEFGSGSIPCDGLINCPDDDNVPIFMDTGTHGLTTDFLLYKDPDFAVGQGVFLKKQGEGLKAHDLGLLVDTTVVPSIDDSKGTFDCSGSGDFNAGIVTGTSGEPGGSLHVDYIDLGGVLDFFVC